MAQRIKEHNWADTPLGPITSWPQCLRTVVDICLGSPFPATLLWGPRLTLLHNDAQIPVLGARAPDALGRPGPQVLADSWPVLGPAVAQVLETGEGLSVPDLVVMLNSGAGVRTAHFTASFSLARDDAGYPAGVLISALETSMGGQVASLVHESETRYRALATASSDVIYRMSPDWNEMGRLDGRGFLLDMHSPTTTWMGTYILPEDQAHVAAVIAEAVRTASPFELEHRVRQADGSPGWTRSRAIPIVDEHGAITEWIGTASDVTAQKVAEATLRQSEERYRTLFQAMDQGFCTIEVCFDSTDQATDYIFLEVNPAFARTTGLTDAIGQRVRDLVPEHEAHWFETFGRVARTGVPERFEAQAAVLGRWYNVYAYRLGDPGAKRVAVLFEDITARRRAEAALRQTESHLRERATKALRESESRLVTLLENLPDYAIFMVDPAGVITEWTEGGRRVKGYAAEEVLGRHFSLFYTPEDQAARLPDRILAEAAHRGCSENEGWRVRKSGERFWANEIATAVRDTAGKLVGFTKISRDLTERRQAEAALQESEERYRRIVEQAADYAIFSIDAEQRIETWPAGAQRVFGWTAEEAIGQPVNITFTPEDRVTGVPEEEVRQARENGFAPDVRWHQCKDGTRVFIEGMSYRRVTDSGDFYGVFKVGQDVTDRILAEDGQREEEIRRREELEAEVAAATLELRALSRRLLLVQEEERRKLALELHDEIGQVLTGLTFQLAAGRGQSEAALAEANATVEKLTEQVRQLALDLRPQVLDRYGLLAAVRWYVERYQATTSITVHLREQDVAHQRYPAEVEIAAFRVVQEALTNVARYAGVDAAWVTLFCNGSLLLVIHDQGQGFDPEQYRESSGLGGMRERVELLGGSFELETTPGEGVHITAEFPLEDVASARPIAEQGRTTEGVPT
jgi:PAS domain S-box-containing protein